MSLSQNARDASVMSPTDAILEFINPGCQRLLDIGCGAGHLSDGLVSGRRTVVALDPFVVPGAPALRIQGDAEPLPVIDDTFDSALFHWSLHHVPQHQMSLALSEAVRVMTQTGILYVVEPEPIGSWHEVCQSFHDETVVQNSAAVEVDLLVQQSEGRRRQAYYFYEDQYDSFDEWVTELMEMPHNGYSEKAVRSSLVKDQFERCREATKYVLRQRVRMDEIRWD